MGEQLKTKRANLRFVKTAAVALIVLLFLQTPIGQASFLADPDRAMLDLAYIWRRNELRAPAPPVVYVRIDDVSVAQYWEKVRGTTLFPTSASSSAGSALTVTPPSTPRGLIADLLDLARASQGAQRARVVLLDVDIAWAAQDEEGEARLIEALRSWSQDARAPLLVVARETTAATAQRTMASANGIRLLPPSPPMDSIVRSAPNIVYAIVSFEFDPGGVAREYDVAACAITPEGRVALPSAVSAAEAANRTRDAASAKAELRRRLGPLQAACVAGNLERLPRPLPIGYHLAVGPDHERPLSEGERMGAAPVHRNWRQADVCGQGRPSAQWIPADELLEARTQTETRTLADFVCGAIVVIGGSTSLQPDVHLSPYGLMDGAMILANAARARLIAAEMPAPLGRAFHILFQIVSVMLTVWLIHLAFKWIGWMRARLERHRGKHKGGALIFWRLGRVATHPIALGWLAPICIFFAGAAFTVMTLQFGLWGTLSVPAFSAALAETVIEWDAEMEA